MMDYKQQQAILTLLKSALTGETYSLPDDFDLDFAISYAKKSQVSSLMYYGAVNCGIPRSSAQMQQLFATVYGAILMDNQQLDELSKITTSFQNNGIKHLVMKGIWLKAIYPQSDMRTMSDLDILIDESQYDIIAPVMKEMGYHEGVESDHELPWIKGRVYVELHRRLISRHNKDFYSYFGDGWKFAKPVANQAYQYTLSHEDIFIYLFTHLVKHYRSGGIGVKHMLDLWVYLRTYPNMDTQYIEAAMTQMQLIDFYRNILATLKVWFEGATSNEITDLISHVILNSGAFGNFEDRLAALLIRDYKTENRRYSKTNELLQLFFPSYQKMSIKYPVLKKYPMLLPFMWLHRGFSSLIGHSGKLHAFHKNVTLVTNDKVSLYQKSLQKVGLDYNFEE